VDRLRQARALPGLRRHRPSPRRSSVTAGTAGTSAW
jgi:hypothetical protein